jgi:UDP-glucose 4-epimerase
VFDNLSSGKTSNLDAELDLVTGDVRSGADLGRAMRGVDAVLHLAAMTSVARSWKEPVDVLDVNTQGTVNVVEAARAAGVSVLIYSSSSSVYGNQPARRKSEELPARPISPPPRPR